MAFICTIPQGGFRVQVFVASTDIGYDDVEPLNYKVAAGLDTLAGRSRELSFHVIEADGQADEEHTF
ncbi:hypothetical protein [Methylobacterium sp. SI9]|uniref:hypothetical protein n=1 Tax=Methylobacterium guangdongense TaxID=3138811 RepID=UPI00313CAFAD